MQARHKLLELPCQKLQDAIIHVPEDVWNHVISSATMVAAAVAGEVASRTAWLIAKLTAAVKITIATVEEVAIIYAIAGVLVLATTVVMAVAKALLIKDDNQLFQEINANVVNIGKRKGWKIIYGQEK